MKSCRYIPGNTNEAIILTHGLSSSISGRSLKAVQDYFSNRTFATLAFDMYGHGEHNGNMLDFTFSKIYDQFSEAYSFLINEGYTDISLYAVSASGLPAIKFAQNNKIKSVFLRIPVIDMYAKRCRELGSKKMEKWKKDKKISVQKHFKTGEDVIISYDFITDLIDNFGDQDVSLILGTNFFIYGGVQDKEVPINELRDFAKRNTRNTQLIEFKDEGHNFSEEGIQKFLKHIDSVIELDS